MFKSFPNFRQYDEMDCGPTCLRIIARHYGKNISLEYLRSLSYTSREGSSLLGISTAAERIGFRTMGAKTKFDDLIKSNPVPFICYWHQQHFIVVYKISVTRVYVSDPGHGLISYKKADFITGWSTDGQTGVVLLLQPTPDFHLSEEEKRDKKSEGVYFILKYFKEYKKLIFQLIIGLISISIIQLIFPFLTKSIVDIGIGQNNLNFVYLVLAAQIFLFIGRTSIELIRGNLLLHLSSHINISMLADFFIKLMNLPINFYDTKMTGDIIQRIYDHQKVENLLTGGTLNALFSIISLFVFSIVLGSYDYRILILFLTGSLLYFLWINLFVKKRADLDYKKFNQNALTTQKNFELIQGMQEIKLCTAEQKKRWEWESIQVKLFKLNVNSLYIKQVQIDGASIINELKNIFITFLSVKLVIDGDITLGTMLSISYMTGQLNGPIIQLTEFFQNFQDTKLSIERINEIHHRDDEEKKNDETVSEMIPIGEDIKISKVSFKYNYNAASPFILNNLDFVIKKKKITAIVGTSGSGKTTLLKLLLKFYEPTSGEIKVGNTPMIHLSHAAWRNKCGVVMQEGFIFNDSIANNIAVGYHTIDKERLIEASRLANIYDFIHDLPLNFNTKIGSSGIGISTGQKQRILIARAIYKDPEFLFFDEATSALDANNEKVIMENLNQYFIGKTVVIIAHRLSTVKHADQIMVLEKGEIAEFGNHDSLISLKGYYFNLVKNQLELGE
jgi:ATP-binding cassette subfamily B protein